MASDLSPGWERVQLVAGVLTVLVVGTLTAAVVAVATSARPSVIRARVRRALA